MQNHDVVILGGGATGLATAWNLNGVNTIVLEREDLAGGLCRSFAIADVVFDIGGHSFHTENAELHSFVRNELGVELFWQKRDARILFRGRTIPYPFQWHFPLLPDRSVVEDCQRGLSRRRKLAEPKNLEEFLVAKHGEGIARHFLLPYNRKLWQTDLQRLDCTWANERVAPPANESVAPRTANTQTRPLVAGSMVAYPRHGGFGELFRRMSAKLHVACRQTVTSIDLDSRSITIGRSGRLGWKVLVSTIPLPDLVRIIRQVPRSIAQDVENLEYVSLRVDFFVVKSHLSGVPQRLYSAESSFPPHKVAFNSLSSDYEAKKRYHSIICETSIPRYNMYCGSRTTQKIVDSLLAAGVISSTGQIVEHQSMMVKYAYPIQTHNVKSFVTPVSEFLQRHHVFTAGRFGQWEYVNSDQCLAKGFSLSKVVQKELVSIAHEA